MTTHPDALGLVGTTIADKYVVETVVGEGGFAIVYRAMHTLWKRPVAVKVFKALGEVAAKDREKLLADFIQEGALLADLSERSSAIVQARDVGMLTTARGEHVPYMVLEWLEGAPLEAVIENERVQGLGLRSLDDTVRLLDSAAEALALAHRKGIAHRDVKPANVFVLGDPRGDFSVKLLDFGIAKVVQDAQKMGFGKTSGEITSFTPSYGAPEQFNRGIGSTGPWTDVFALALVAVEVLTGRDPLDGDTLLQLAFAAGDPNKRPTPQTRGAHILPAAEVIFQKALAVRPADRYQTAGDFWNALRLVVLGQGMSIARGESTREFTAGSGVKIPREAFAETAVAPPSSPTSSPSVPNPQAMTLPRPMAKQPPYALIGLAAVALLAGAGGAAWAYKKKQAPKPVSSTPMIVASAPMGATCPPGMKLIPGGQYYMGSDEKSASDDEKPPHQVKLGAYCLDELEVTVAQYKECTNNGDCLRAGQQNWWENISKAESALYDPLCNANDLEGKQKHPINCVNWEQARKYCDTHASRLPTEAEWEFAARGRDGRIYPWGDALPSFEHLNACGGECVAWMKAHPDPNVTIASMFPDNDGFAQTAPVGSFPKGASQWGIQDMVGNVFEWVGDWYGKYDSQTETNPAGPGAGTERVARGGSFNASDPNWVRPSFRFKLDPKNRTYGIGFRCAKSL